MGEDDDYTWFVTLDNLTRRVTIDEYVSDRFGPFVSAHMQTCDVLTIQQWLEKQKQPLEALAVRGDEWWEWISGTEPLMQSGGLALVRAGQIVWARQDWIS